MGGWCGMGTDCPEILNGIVDTKLEIWQDKVMVDLMLQWQ